MVTTRARWVMPQAGQVLHGGCVVAAHGHVTAVEATPRAGARDLGDVVVLPGLVNAHTHLELSWMSGLVAPAESMDQWIQSMMARRRSGPAGGDADVVAHMVRAAGAMRATGTVLVGDISNSLTSAAVLAQSGLSATIFHEILGFAPADVSSNVRAAHERLSRVLAPTQVGSVVAHAPYSTSPALFREIARSHDGAAPLTVHLAESYEEMEFLRSAGGPIRVMLDRLGVWDPAWQPPGEHPVDYLHHLGYLRPGTLLVHGVYLSLRDLEAARRARAVVVTCPRSNTWVAGGVPPVARFYASGVDVAIGTDSLASTDTLNVFDELAALRRLAPEVTAGRLLDSATRIGAIALGWGTTLGRLAPGYLATAATVRVPSSISSAADVEEYLVSGVPPADVALVDLSAA